MTNFLPFHTLLENMDLEVILQGLETDGQSLPDKKSVPDEEN